MKYKDQDGFTVIELVIVVVIAGILASIYLKGDKESNKQTNGLESVISEEPTVQSEEVDERIKENEISDEVPFYVKLWPFGPYGLICQYVAPVAYTDAMSSLLMKLGGCNKNRTRRTQQVAGNLSDEFIMAASQGDVEKVKYLIQAGANVNASAPSTSQVPAGITPLMLAAAKDHINVAKILLSEGANPNQTDNGGGTAIIYAVWKGHVDIVELLIEYDAEINAKTKDGRTPLKLANNSGDQELVRILEKAGATR